MTQPPPPPPNQPPRQPAQNGFGAPQPPPPPAGGFGAPQPLQNPAYGAPQPPQNPAYGYPQPPQNPAYGYPQGPGYPQPPGHPTQSPPVAVKKKANAQLLIIVSAVAAIALIVGGGVWYSSTQGDDNKQATGTNEGKDTKGGTDGGGETSGGTAGEKVPSDPASEVLFQLPAPEVKEKSTYNVMGSWLTDKAYVKSGIAEVSGYDPDKGSKLWTIELPGPVCAATGRTTADNRTAIAYEPAMPTKEQPSHGCTEVAGIDLDAGKKLWTASAKSGDQKISFGSLTLSGTTVAVGGSSGGAAFDLADGKQLWAPKNTDDCHDAGYGGGAALVAVRKCGTYDDQRLLIQTINPASGAVLSEYRMADGIRYAGIVSTSPLVVAADVGDTAGDGSGISDLFSIDGKTGELRTKISVPGDQYAAKCDTITKIEACSRITVGNDRVYLPTEEHDGSGASYSRTNEIVAFDLGTGKQTGQRADAGDGYTISPLRMDGGNIIAYKRPPYDKGGQIVSIDGSSFEETKLLENPATDTVREAEAKFSPDYSELLYRQGHLYMAGVYASKPLASGGESYLAIAFGAG